jgi:hypothetical protein
MQSCGSFGERNIVKKPLELPIPKYDSSNKKHIQLVELTRESELIVKRELPSLVSKYSGLAKIRKELKKMLEAQNNKIDKIVSEFINAKK